LRSLGFGVFRFVYGGEGFGLEDEEDSLRLSFFVVEQYSSTTYPKTVVLLLLAADQDFLADRSLKTPTPPFAFMCICTFHAREWIGLDWIGLGFEEMKEERELRA
jgi:hypothetical protein